MNLRSVESVLALSVVGLACFIGGQAVGMRRAGTHQISTGAIAGAIGSAMVDSGAPTARDTDDFGFRVDATSADAQRSAFLTAAPEMSVSDAPASSAGAIPAGAMPALSPRDLRRRIDDGVSGTYLDELIRLRDSALVRWPDRTTRPLRVWVAEDVHLTGWNPDFLPAVRDAFDTWTATGIPVRFTFIIDSASADVHVRFTERFSNGISGKTVWSRNSAWWLVSSDIQLALAHPSGGAVTPPQIRAIALHEVGHLLGLDHASAPEHIMSARIRVRELTEADRATVRLLYSVPAGSLR